MAKVTWRDLKPDDPIFTQGPSVFTPMSKPSTVSSRKNIETSEAHKMFAEMMKMRLENESALQSPRKVPEVQAVTKPVAQRKPKKR